MKDAARRPVLVPALVLCAVLTTWTEAARAGGEPVAPFPGTSVSGTGVSGTSVSGAVEDGEGKSAEVSPPPSGAQAAGPEAGPGVRGAAAEGDATADAGAEVPVTTAPAVGAESSDAAPTAGAMTPARVSAAKADMPAGGSRLLRALAELPGTLGPARSDVPGEVALPGTPRVFAAEGCPRALLRRLLAGAAGEADALSALGIEREILTLCRERQEILAGLFETEARLRELREAGRAPETQTAVTAAGAAPAFREGARSEAAAVETAAPSPLRVAPSAPAETRVAETRVPETLAPGKANEADARAGDTDAAEPPPPRYAWFSIIGTAGALRAGVTDGSGVWFVREGDALPGGASVAAIAGRPPGVRVTGVGVSGEAALLPFGARPGGAP